MKRGLRDHARRTPEGERDASRARHAGGKRRAGQVFFYFGLVSSFFFPLKWIEITKWLLG